MKKKASNNFLKKIFLSISIIGILVFIILNLLIIYSDNQIVTDFKKKIPTPIKNQFKKVLYFTILQRENKELKSFNDKMIKEVADLQNKVLTLESKLYSGSTVEENIILEDYEFHLKKIFVPFDNQNIEKKIKSAYLSIYKDNIIVVFWSGNIISIKKDDLSKKEVTTKNIESNLSSFVTKKDKYVSIKDIIIIDGILYASYTKLISGTNCVNTSIVKADMSNFNKLKFKNFFTYDDCVSARFAGYQAGGRLEKYKNNKIILTIGDFQNFGESQNLSNYFGSIISIDTKTLKTEFLSIGHRNPQGLFYLKEKNILMSTEHGPKGGDEINKILINNNEVPNYGWPISSYGNYYGYESYEDRKKAPLNKSHSDYGFIEPIKYFSPSLGISQIITAENFKNIFNENTLIVASLKNQKLYFVEFNDDFSKFKSQKNLKIGERIRDIIKFDEDKYMLFLEDSPAIGILSIN